MFCIKCGNKTSEGDKYCQHCGELADDTNIDQSTNINTSKEKKSIWKPILIIIVVIAFIGWIVYESEGDYTNSSSLVNVGLYNCTDHHATQADKIAPRVEYFTDEITKLEELYQEIENTYVDEYSEVSVNNYNNKLSKYDEQWDSLEKEINVIYGSIDVYNTKVDQYNAYLESNCNKR